MKGISTFFLKGGGDISEWKDTCWQIIWPSVWATTLHAKLSCPINYKRHASRPSCTHCLIYPRWPVHTADILFWALRLVIGSGHTTQTLTWGTLEPLSHPSTSASHKLRLDNTHSVLTFKCSCVGHWEHESGSTPGMSLNTARSKDLLLLRRYALEILAWHVFLRVKRATVVV